MPTTSAMGRQVKVMHAPVWRLRLGGWAGVKRHNRNNAMLKDGLEALGAHWAEIPRNCAASGHDCGYCGFGCASGGKQDASGTWLLDAVSAGARILTGRALAPGPGF